VRGQKNSPAGEKWEAVIRGPMGIRKACKVASGINGVKTLGEGAVQGKDRRAANLN